MTVRQFMLKKFPTSKYMDCPIPQHHWEVIQEYANEYSSEQLEAAQKETKNYKRLFELAKQFTDKAEKQAFENYVDKVSVESEKDMNAILTGELEATNKRIFELEGRLTELLKWVDKDTNEWNYRSAIEWAEKTLTNKEVE